MKKRLMISLSDLRDVPCKKYLEYIQETYGNKPFNAFDVFEKMNAKASHVSWLIENCPLAQTPDMIEYFKSLNPKASDVSWLIACCAYTQTPEMIEYFKSLNPTAGDVSWLIACCAYTQTPEMFDYYLSLNPDIRDILWLIDRCSLAKENLKLQKAINYLTASTTKSRKNKY